MTQDGLYGPFEAFRIINYWSSQDLCGVLLEGPFMNQQPGPVLSIIVCFVAVALPVLAALWLFRRKTY